MSAADGRLRSAASGAVAALCWRTLYWLFEAGEPCPAGAFTRGRVASRGGTTHHGSKYLSPAEMAEYQRALADNSTGAEQKLSESAILKDTGPGCRPNSATSRCKVRRNPTSTVSVKVTEFGWYSPLRAKRLAMSRDARERFSSLIQLPPRSGSLERTPEAVGPKAHSGSPAGGLVNEPVAAHCCCIKIRTPDLLHAMPGGFV